VEDKVTGTCGGNCNGLFSFRTSFDVSLTDNLIVSLTMFVSYMALMTCHVDNDGPQKIWYH